MVLTHISIRNGADLLVATLQANGVRRVFGVPGEENAHMLRALETSDIDVVLARHEQGAAFMAYGHGRITGEPGVCFATLGPGATNLVTGLAAATLDGAPVLAVTAQAPMENLNARAHQVLDVSALMKPVTLASFPVRAAETISEAVVDALMRARAPQPGAVHIELPEDLAGRDVNGLPLTGSQAPAARANDEAMGALLRRLADARQPVILAGGGATAPGVSTALNQFVAQTGIAVVTSMAGKGSVDERRHQHVRTVGAGPDAAEAMPKRADLLVCVGFDPVEGALDALGAPPTADIVHVGDYEVSPREGHWADHYVIGDIADTITRLTLSLAGRSFDRSDRPDADADLEPADALDAAVCDLQAAAPADAVVFSGVGRHKMALARGYRAAHANGCIISNGLAAMGMALPAAVGAQLAVRDAPVLAFVGDGDIMMGLQEMETARRVGANITVNVLVDGEFGLIADKQEEAFGGHTDVRFGDVDWPALGAAFGWSVAAAAPGEANAAALREAIARDAPSLVITRLNSPPTGSVLRNEE